MAQREYTRSLASALVRAAHLATTSGQTAIILKVSGQYTVRSAHPHYPAEMVAYTITATPIRKEVTS